MKRYFDMAELEKLTREELFLILEELQPIEDNTRDNLLILNIRERIEEALRNSRNSGNLWESFEIERVLPLNSINLVSSALSVMGQGEGDEGRIMQAGRVKIKLKVVFEYYNESYSKNISK